MELLMVKESGSIQPITPGRGWSIFYSIFVIDIAAFLFTLFLMRPIWFDINDELVKMIGPAFQWLTAIGLLTVVCLFYALYLLNKRLRSVKSGNGGRPGLLHILLPSFIMIVWTATIVYLLMEMGEERSMIKYIFLETLPWIVLALVLAGLWLLQPFVKLLTQRWERFNPGPFWSGIAVVVLVILSLFFAASYPLCNRIAAGPYLQNPGENSMTIMWMTEKGSRSWVEYGSDEKLGSRADSSTHGLINAGSRIQKITIKGLKPGKKYYYRIVSRTVERLDPINAVFGDMLKGDIESFTTLDRGKDSVSAAVFNDIHEQEEVIGTMMGSIKGKAPDLVFYNGDMLNHLDSHRQVVGELFRPASEYFASGTPLLMARGNHETRGPLARSFNRYLDTPGNRYYYAFSHGPVRFIVLDGGEGGEDSWYEHSGLAAFEKYHREQTAWLKSEVRGPAFRDALYRVVIVHIAIDSAKSPKEMEGSEPYRAEMASILNSHGITLLLSGHTHEYELLPPVAGKRSYPIMIGGDFHMKDDNATMIRVDADRKGLKAEMLLFGPDGTGKVKESLTVQPAR